MKIKPPALLMVHLIILVCSGFFGAVKASAQTEWTFVALTGSGSIIYIDYNFTKVSGGITQVWQKTILEDGTYTIGLSEWSCSKKSFRMGRSALYGENGLI